MIELVDELLSSGLDILGFKLVNGHTVWLAFDEAQVAQPLPTHGSVTLIYGINQRTNQPTYIVPAHVTAVVL